MTDNDDKHEQASRLRRKAEEIARGKAARPPEELEDLSSGDMRRTLHELRVHQIELEMQNDELRRTQVELDAARERYFDLYDLAPVSYYTVSEQGLIQEANLTAAALLGVDRGALSRQPFTRFIRKDDQDIHYLHRKRLLETGEPQAYDLRMVKTDGTAFWGHLTATAAHDCDGALVCRIALNDITELKRAEKALKASLAEKVVLLREVHHRVKNNLAAIIGLLDLQMDEIADEAALASLKDLSDRIMSMALIHERLYRSEKMARIDIQEYLGDLTSHLLKSFGVEHNIRCIVEAAEVELELDTAIPIGLIINELLTNAMKHAFPAGETRQGAEECEILITVRQDKENFTLIVADNGVGLPSDLDWRSCSSLGLRLISMLGENQLRGQIQLDQAEGTRFILRFSD